MSPTAEAQMVKLPKVLVARLDDARGDVSRPDFLGALLDEYERQDGHAQRKEPPTRPRVKRPDPTRVETGSLVGRGAVKPGNCSHPVHRRIGDGCADCGATGLAVKAKR